MDATTNTNENKKGLSHILDFNLEMEENDIMLVYCGEFSQDLNKTLLSFIERKFKSEKLEDGTRRKIFNIMVEMLQNISKNKIDPGEEVPEIDSLFMLGLKDAHFIMISSNLILNEKIPALQNRIEEVNALDKEGLKQLYKDVRLHNSFSESAGAGIGMIDIARKSENKLEYGFEKANEKYSVFSLLIRVNK